jgi:hypothetical protein
LAEDFSFADHLGVEAGGDVEDVGDDVLMLFPEDELAEFGGVEEVEFSEVFEELRTEGGRFGIIRDHSVEFDAVAGVEDEGFGEVEAGGAAEEFVNGVETVGGNGEALAHREGGGAVGAAEEEQLWDGRRHQKAKTEFKRGIQNSKLKIQDGRGVKTLKG